MIVQTFKTHCESCGEEVVSKTADMTGTNEIIVDFMEGMEFECSGCGDTTHLDIEKYTS